MFISYSVLLTLLYYFNFIIVCIQSQQHIVQNNHLQHQYTITHHHHQYHRNQIVHNKQENVNIINNNNHIIINGKNHNIGNIDERYNIYELLNTIKNELKYQNYPCTITFSIDHLFLNFFNHILSTHKSRLNLEFSFYKDHRQFMNEFLLLQYFQSSKCLNQIKNTIPSMRPHYYIIYFPFKYIVSIQKYLTYEEKENIRIMFSKLLNKDSFKYDKEHYILIHISTLDFRYLTNNNILNRQQFLTLFDKRIVRIGIEGIGGDNRVGKRGIDTIYSMNIGNVNIVITYMY